MYYQREMAYDYKDSVIYYITANDFLKGKISIHRYDLRLKRSDTITCIVPDDLFSKTLLPYPKKMEVSENRIIIKMYDHLLFLEYKKSTLKLIRYLKNTSLPNYIHHLTDSTVIYTESNMAFGTKQNSAYTKFTIYDYYNNTVLNVKIMDDPSSYSWYGIHDARVCSRGDSLFFADKWLRKMWLLNPELEKVDSFRIPASQTLNPEIDKRKNTKLIKRMDEPVEDQRQFYKKFTSFIESTYHIQGFYTLNDSAFLIAYIMGEGNAMFEVVELKNGQLKSTGLQADNSPNDNEVLTPYNIHNIFIRRTLKVSENKIIIFENHPKAYPIGAAKGLFYEETMVYGHEMDNCELAIYIFDIAY